MDGDKYENGLFIFRRDLRIEDNTGLNYAIKMCKNVYTLFNFTPEQVVKNSFKSNNAIHFMIESLESLQTNIKKHGGKLIILFGEQDIILKRVINQLEIDAIFINKDITPYAIKRENEVERIAKQYDIELYLCDDYYIHQPGTILSGSNKPYVKFTPYYNTAKLTKHREPYTISSLKLKNYNSNITGQITLENALKKFGGEDSPERLAIGGREEGLDLLKQAKNIHNYEATRNDLSTQTTELSAHIKFGTVSIREIYNAVKHNQSLIRQLYWRDFYAQLLYNNPEVLKESMRPSLKDLNWENNIKFQKAWKEGKTGFPIVDAGMRQLNQTGYMHNRARLITASFLIKTLLQNWQVGEKYFAQMLTDYDPANNNGNWQWVASTGADSQPYFRIFNPWLQGKENDPDAIYIKKWIPELKDVPSKDIHNWEKIYEKYENIKYPEPIVNYEEQKQKALKIYRSALRT
jgi:deoxyribodipyrimidine photo-lyase